MKAFSVTLSKKEGIALSPIIERIQAGKKMMFEGAAMMKEYEPKLWERLNDLLPKYNTGVEVDKSFNYDTRTMSGFLPEGKADEYKMLKEKAIRDKDFEAAAKYRDMERTEKLKKGRA